MMLRPLALAVAALTLAGASVANAQSVYLYVAPGASVYVTPNGPDYNGAPAVYPGTYPGSYAPAPVVVAPAPAPRGRAAGLRSSRARLCSDLRCAASGLRRCAPDRTAASRLS